MMYNDQVAASRPLWRCRHWHWGIHKSAQRKRCISVVINGFGNWICYPFC